MNGKNINQRIVTSKIEEQISVLTNLTKLDIQKTSAINRSKSKPVKLGKSHKKLYFVGGYIVLCVIIDVLLYQMLVFMF